MDFICPITKSPLSFFPRDQLGELVADPSCIGANVTAAYISQDAGLAFPLDNGIHNFLPAEAIVLRSGVATITKGKAEPKNESVRTWYDEFGWLRNEDGVFNDSALFSFKELNVAKLYEVLSHLHLVSRLGSGKFLLDAASGPLPHREHLAYSFFFEQRVCVDFSKTALLSAKAKLGDAAIYVMADICRLPFEDMTFDGIISGYTIMHIDATDQETAVSELYRVLQRNRHLIIVNGNENPEDKIARRLFILFCRAWGKLTRHGRPVPDQTVDRHSAPPLYCHAAPVKWWKDLSKNLNAQVRVECMRFFSNSEMSWLFGHLPGSVLKIRGIETLLSRIMAPYSTYLLIDFRKP